MKLPWWKITRKKFLVQDQNLYHPKIYYILASGLPLLTTSHTDSYTDFWAMLFTQTNKQTNQCKKQSLFDRVKYPNLHVGHAVIIFCMLQNLQCKHALTVDYQADYVCLTECPACQNTLHTLLNYIQSQNQFIQIIW